MKSYETIYLLLNNDKNIYPKDHLQSNLTKRRWTSLKFFKLFYLNYAWIERFHYNQYSTQKASFDRLEKNQYTHPNFHKKPFHLIQQKDPAEKLQ